jgi:hypothetical protein
MTKQSELKRAREEMHQFLSGTYTFENGVFKRDDFDVFAWSRPKEAKDQLGVSFRNHPSELDNDWREQKAYFEAVVDHVVRTNNNHRIPAFVFLHTRTDYEQKALEDRVRSPVNRIGGNKQVLGTSYQTNPFNDIRKLDKHEVAVWGLGKHAGIEPDYVKYKGLYLSELTHFNVKKGALQTAMYKNVFSETPYRRLEVCPTCSNTKETHGACKKNSLPYKKSIIERSQERSYKYLHIVYEQASLIPQAVELDRTVLENWSAVPLEKEVYKIGLFH